MGSHERIFPRNVRSTSRCILLYGFWPLKPIKTDKITQKTHRLTFPSEVKNLPSHMGWLGRLDWWQGFAAKSGNSASRHFVVARKRQIEITYFRFCVIRYHLSALI